MAQLRQDFAEFKKRQTRVVVIGPENANAFEAYFREHDLPFIGLPDPTASVLKMYGQEVNLFKLGRMPAQVIVDKEGMARFVHYGHTMADIPENAELLDLLDTIRVSINFSTSTAISSTSSISDRLGSERCVGYNVWNPI